MGWCMPAGRLWQLYICTLSLVPTKEPFEHSGVAKVFLIIQMNIYTQKQTEKTNLWSPKGTVKWGRDKSGVWGYQIQTTIHCRRRRIKERQTLARAAKEVYNQLFIIDKV